MKYSCQEVSSCAPRPADDKVFNNIESYGNTTAGTIPIAFHEVLEQGRAKVGDLVAFVGLGSGLNWGAVLYRC